MVASDLQNLLLLEGEKQQLIEFNPDAALQRSIFADDFVPNSPEFVLQISGNVYVGQRAEQLDSDQVRVYYAINGDWDNVRFVEGSETTIAPLAQRLLNEGNQRQVLQFNQNAALQKRILDDQFVPNSNEFRVRFGGTTYLAQRAEDLQTGTVHVYFARSGEFGDIQFVDRNP